MAKAKKKLASEGEAKPAFRDRFLAWWRGEELRTGAIKDGLDQIGEFDTRAITTQQELKEQADKPDALWPAARISVIQRLFGEGYTSPGGAEAVEEMLKPLGVNETMSLGFIGGGLGGPGRFIATSANAWVTSYVNDPDQAEAGHQMSVKLGMEKRAPVVCADLQNLEVKPKSFNCVLAKERFFTVEDKAALFKQIATLLRDYGQLMFTDYMKAESGNGGEEMKKWRTFEPIPPHLIDIEETKALLTDIGMDVRISMDITGSFCHRLVQDFANLAGSIKDAPLTANEKKWVVMEAETWLHRVAAIDAGGLKVYRVYANLTK